MEGQRLALPLLVIPAPPAQPGAGRFDGLYRFTSLSA
jgi:hypothetical protein